MLKLKNLLLEDDDAGTDFAARSKQTGRIVYYKSKENMADAIKAGKAEKLEKTASSSQSDDSAPEKKNKVNIFGTPKPKSDKVKPKTGDSANKYLAGLIGPGEFDQLTDEIGADSVAKIGGLVKDIDQEVDGMELEDWQQKMFDKLDYHFPLDSPEGIIDYLLDYGKFAANVLERDDLIDHMGNIKSGNEPTAEPSKEDFDDLQNELSGMDDGEGESAQMDVRDDWIYEWMKDHDLDPEDEDEWERIEMKFLDSLESPGTNNEAVVSETINPKFVVHKGKKVIGFTEVQMQALKASRDMRAEWSTVEDFKKKYGTAIFKRMAQQKEGFPGVASVTEAKLTPKQLFEDSIKRYTKKLVDPNRGGLGFRNQGRR